MAQEIWVITFVYVLIDNIIINILYTCIYIYIIHVHVHVAANIKIFIIIL